MNLPDKQTFKIGEVAAIVGVKPSVLRFWETEFRTLRPDKSRTNQRLYSRKQVEKALAIKALLYDQGFTIAGARKKLAGRGDGELDRELREKLAHEVRELLQLVGE